MLISARAEVNPAKRTCLVFAIVYTLYEAIVEANRCEKIVEEA